MKTIKGIFGQSILAGILILTLFLIAKQANAQDKTDSSSMNASNLNAEPNDGTVEIIYPAEALAPYTERRGNWSTIAGVNVDLIYPDKFRSKIDATTSYDSLFESYPMSVVQLELGAKYNTAIGSFGIGALGGIASSTSP